MRGVKRTFVAACAAGLLMPAAMTAQTDLVPEAPPVPAVSPEDVLGPPTGPPVSGEALDAETDDLTSIMRCPVCQALSVNDSPSVSAIAMKEEVRDLLAMGYSRDQVIVYFEKAYGEFIRLEPKATGFNLVVWIAPAIALMIGLGLVVVRLRRPSAGAVDDASEESDSTADRAPAEPEGEDDLEAFLQQVRREVGA